MDLPGRTLRGEEKEEEEYGERLWLDIVFEKLSFLLLLLWHRCFAMEFSLANRLNGSWR